MKETTEREQVREKEGEFGAKRKGGRSALDVQLFVLELR